MSCSHCESGFIVVDHVEVRDHSIPVVDACPYCPAGESRHNWMEAVLSEDLEELIERQSGETPMTLDEVAAYIGLDISDV